MNSKSACPLDCFDSCVIEYREGVIKADKSDTYTAGYLCPFMNHYEKYERIEKPSYNGIEISMDEALEILANILRKTDPLKTLYFKGNANMGVMQNVTSHLFASLGTVKADGSICSGAGDAGIEEGRGVNLPLTLEQIANSEVVVLWGRNPHTSNSHLLPIIKGKKLIVIDPIKIDAVKSADLHIQLKPHGDLFLALLIARFVIIEGAEDKEFLDKYCEDHEDFYELTQSLRIKKTVEEIGITLGQIGEFMSHVKNKKTVFLVGTGVQRYRNGSEIIRSIDSLAAVLGLFGKSGCGVGFLSDSTYGVEMPFKKFKKSSPKATIDFSKYETVFIQGSNPLSQLPNSKKLEKEIKKCENVVYFALFENESSKVANLIIPAKTFLEKNDIRFSYGSERVTEMRSVKESAIGISEYEFSKYLCNVFDIKLDSEESYLNHFKSYLEDFADVKRLKKMPKIAYEDGFLTDDEKFILLDELDHSMTLESNELFLLTNSSKTSLNSQFKRQNCIYLHKSFGFEDGEHVKIISNIGEVVLEVKNSDTIREDCVMIYKGTKGLNNLTPSILSYEGKSAAFQDIRVKIEKI